MYSLDFVKYNSIVQYCTDNITIKIIREKAQEHFRFLFMKKYYIIEIYYIAEIYKLYIALHALYITLHE